MNVPFVGHHSHAYRWIAAGRLRGKPLGFTPLLVRGFFGQDSINPA